LTTASASEAGVSVDAGEAVGGAGEAVGGAGVAEGGGDVAVGGMGVKVGLGVMMAGARVG